MKGKCVKCETKFEFEDDGSGEIRCPSCGATMRIKSKAAAPPTETATASADAPAPSPSGDAPGGDAPAGDARPLLPPTMRANKIVAGRTCPGCGKPIALGVEVHNCESCSSSHHAACWDAAAGCASPTCPSKLAPVSTAPAKQLGGGAARPSSPGETKPCRFCGEQIAKAARKCRFCDEFQSELDRKSAAARATTGDDKLTGGEILFGILCGGIACIVGIVWTIQGKKKGPKLIALSLITQLIIGILQAIIGAANR